MNIPISYPGDVYPTDCVGAGDDLLPRGPQRLLALQQYYLRHSGQIYQVKYSYYLHVHIIIYISLF